MPVRWAIRALAIATNLLAAASAEAQLSSPISLEDVGGSVAGVRFVGFTDLNAYAGFGEYAGQAISSAGDVNGDGFTDFIFGCPRESPDGVPLAGESYLIFGGAGGLGSGGTLDVNSLDGIEGVTLRGSSPFMRLGSSVSGAGDINGDGFEDLLVGAYHFEGTEADYSGKGEAYVIFGSPNGIGVVGDFDPLQLDAAHGVRIRGVDQVFDQVGWSVSGAGDMDGDGMADILVGSRGAGLAHFIQGSSMVGASAEVVYLVDLVGEGTVRFDAPEGNSVGLGYSVAGGGDFNSDGLSDLLMGAPTTTPSGNGGNGAAYLVLGSSAELGVSGVFDLGSLAGADGFRTDGIDAVDMLGGSVSGAGDVDGDGFDDVLYGARGVGNSGDWRNGYGETYLILGDSVLPGSAGLFDPSALNGANGTRVRGITARLEPGLGDLSGVSVCGAGDVDGDGFNEVIIGAPVAGSGGTSYVLYGSSAGLGSSADINLVEVGISAPGVRIEGRGTGNDYSGSSVAGVGDVNGDGFQDLGILQIQEQAFVGSGAAYLIFGDGVGSPGYRAFTRPGDAPHTGIGMIGDGSHSIPFSRVWVDYAAGDDGAGQASSTEVVFRRGGVSDFGPLPIDPSFEWEITTARQGFGTAQITFKGLGVAGESDWQIVLLRRDSGSGLWYAPAQTVDSPLHEITVDEDFASPPARYAMLLGADPDPPVIQTAVLNDANDNGIAEPGEVLSLLFDRGVVLGEVLDETAFDLPVAGDSLGTGVIVTRSATNTRVLDLTLGAGVSLTMAGTFDSGTLGGGSPSGIDIDPGLAPSALTSLVGVPAQPQSGVDLIFTLITGQQTIPATGGAVAVTPSPNARYSQHALTIPNGGLAGDTTIALRPPSDNGGFLNAVQVSPDITFSVPATIRLEYLDSDIDTELGQLESLVHAAQLVEIGGELVPIALPGTQTVDTVANRVDVDISSADPLGSPGVPGLFVTVGLPPIFERTVHIKSSGGAGAAVTLAAATTVTLSPSPESLYALHQIEIPDFESTTDTDPDRVSLSIRAVTPFERISATGGTSFPTQSGALFAVTAESATGEPVAFTAPVNITVQFFDGSNSNPDDIQPLGGTATIGPLGMRVVRDTAEGDAVNFARIGSAIPQSVFLFTGGGLVTAAGVQNLTGPTGKGVWGAAVFVVSTNTTDVGAWELYR